ncbi:type VI secretion system Vgr family protein [Aureliella helgolandensis]|uniref:Phage-related baseplate assembly protein n=1 Tax=Aureliella helgolandensis TaxID=2527968 RepID=A0A518G547_9BACT|nr:type VI secretion system tip protein TssI/VgrG [Aureliella helgolandensis]QDV23711.1 Phage-related baseplate assembly protein [Aureliella helgolandensis]
MRLTTPLPEGSLFISKLNGREAISELYSLEWDVQAPRHRQFDIFSLLGKDVRADIELPRSDSVQALVNGQVPELKTRRFCGMVREATERFEDDDFRYFRLTVCPRLWLSTQSSNCRIFQEQTIPEILKKLLHGLNVEYHLHDEYLPRPYCVQYNETQFEFLKRLCAEAGIFFYFKHQYEGQDDEQRQRGERLVLTDAVPGLPLIESYPDLLDLSGDHADGIVEYERSDGGTREDLRITRWNRTQRLVTTKCTVRDQSFQLPGQTLEANEEIVKSVDVGGVQHELKCVDDDLEIFAYPGRYAKCFDGIAPGGDQRPDSLKHIFSQNALVADRQMQRQAAASIAIDGASNCPNLVPGHRFQLSHSGKTTGPYFVLAVQHAAQLNADFRSADSQEELSYENQFTCQAVSLPYQPLEVHTQPRIHGFQTATVVGPENEELFSDKFGRVKVKFNWDRESAANADSSCWIRVAQVWAGNRWGAFFWPRVGHEVVVVFEHGDPDQPLIVGSVYNAKNMPPIQLPGGLKSGGIKSCTVGGNPIENFSCVIFHDNPGREYLQLHSETHECVTSETAKVNYSTGPGINFQGGSNHLMKMFGSGAGGGPSTPLPASAREQSKGESTSKQPWGMANGPNLSEFEGILDRNVIEAIEAFQEVGSGSGGWIAGVIESAGGFPKQGEHAKEAAERVGMKNEVGSLAVVTGNSLEIGLGGEVKHQFAGSTTVVADLEGLVESLLVALATLAVTREKTDFLKWTQGGELKQFYGSKKDIVYGHAVDIHRGTEMKVTAEHFLRGPVRVVVAGNDKLTYGSALSATAHSAVRAIAILLLLFDIAVAIAIKVEMETPPKESEKPEDSDKDKSKAGDSKKNESVKTSESTEASKKPTSAEIAWKKHIDTLAVWSTRGEAVLLKLETLFEQVFAATTQIENDTTKQVDDLKNITFGLVRVETWSKLRDGIKQKAESVKNSIVKNQRELILLAAGIVFFAGIVGCAAAEGLTSNKSDN